MQPAAAAVAGIATATAVDAISTEPSATRAPWTALWVLNDLSSDSGRTARRDQAVQGVTYRRDRSRRSWARLVTVLLHTR
ncbi:hypothetical protein GCM10009679_35000 [Saccharothrix algeriensis]|uniref:Uncharacterized protein n=1 Tax=Catellatospora bangladeshensis TaxID=310355 RepID=A0A8J3JUQ0_9ACTN|nr:hypothetical protein Cba03nite_48330 [Catellatospora bangladeshensis]